MASLLFKAIHTSRQSCCKAGKARTFTPVSGVIRGIPAGGKLTSSKYAKIQKCSPDTALRDITELVDLGILRKDDAGGRSTSYSLIST
jgi:predicted HTH transcriptional regulator